MLCIIVGLISTALGDDQVLPAPDFETEIAPLLIKRCLECHQGADPSGGLLLETRTGLLKGGDSGYVVDWGHPDGSHLLHRVVAGEMPPDRKGQSQRLPDAEIELLRRWIAAGPLWPDERRLDLFERTNDVRAGLDWWSLQPVVRPEVPRNSRGPSSDHPIDAFIRVRLQSEGLSPAPPADRRTLLRRVYSDLIGLPPTAEQIEAFLADDSPQAWERVIDELLASPHYGERWGRYWLDVVRYADTSGYERDQEKPFAWKYRDWVVRAFNADLPYRQFILEQLAGDELDDRTADSVIATGFLRLGTWNDEPNEPLDYQYDRLEDLVHTTSSAFLGLTVKCARCHDHKFDPIRQDDYYRMASAFWAGPIGARDRALLGGPSADELGMPDVLGWTDLDATPGPLHVLKSGERLQPLHEVAPASLSTIPALERDFTHPPEGAATSGRRRQLAEWIADERNPLTARVLVNRLWQHHFGAGLVRSPNNFGFLADPPTHPDLLDWLAAEFLAGGGRVKRIHKLILTSQTWQQASLHPQEEQYARIDPANRLWWRAERRRLDAESLRDSLLSASGELDLTLGGESVKATVSPEALEGLSRKSAAWKAAPIGQQNRRSLYLFLKRGLLPPMMTAFDLCDATQSCGMRDVTTVPTQALTLLNNEFAHARSRTLAETVLDTGGPETDQIRTVWRATLRRDPTAAELELASRHLHAQRLVFTGREAAPTPENEIDRAAVRSLLRLHLRADQAVATGEDRRVDLVPDLSGHNHHAGQSDPQARPTVVDDGFAGQPILHFDGQGRFLTIDGQPLTDAACTILCVVSDSGPPGHREVLSNWRRNENVGTSLFLGLTGEKTVRFSDDFAAAGEVSERHRPFLMSAVNGPDGAVVFQNGRIIASRTQSLAPRRLDTPWVIGQQGDINGEFWHGGIAEIRVYAGNLSDDERQVIERELADRYGLALDSVPASDAALTPDQFALASLCHVLMNSNEFLYVD